jgi:hypothetical protein
MRARPRDSLDHSGMPLDYFSADTRAWFENAFG